jgi:polyhydroxyalkanoate synthesis regulator phasin
MDTIDLEKLIQQGYYVTLGATSSLLEVIQDPIKREENLRMWGRTFNELSQDLAAKGVSTEAEARSYVDSFIAQRVNGTKPQEETTSLTTVNTTAESVEETNAEASTAKVKSSMRDEIQELTDQLTNLRAELEQLRQK